MCSSPVPSCLATRIKLKGPGSITNNKFNVNSLSLKTIKAAFLGSAQLKLLKIECFQQTVMKR